MIPPRFPSPRTIDRGGRRGLYAAIRRHEVLYPIFAGHVTDWPEHEEKIARFWKNAILYERNYDDSRMQAHMQAGDVQAAHSRPG